MLRLHVTNGTEYKSETYKCTKFYMYIKQEKSQTLILGIL